MFAPQNHLSLIFILLFIFEQVSIADASHKASTSNSFLKKISRITASHRDSRVSAKKAWDTFLQSAKKLEKNFLPFIKQGQAEILYHEKMPIFASSFAANAIKSNKDPLSLDLKPSWKILFLTSRKVPIQHMLEDLSSLEKMKSYQPPFFQNGWNYIVGNRNLNQGKDDQALVSYAKIKAKNRYFLPGLYQTALIHNRKNNFKEALLALNTILGYQKISYDVIKRSEKKQLFDYAHLAKARILYSQKQFSNAVKFYRMVSRNGYQFYDALFEQSWALFLSGNPQHALGSLHGSSSPFFKNHFNPETKVLEAMIYFWLCRYEDSRSSLADFVKNYGDSVEKLQGFLDRHHLSYESSYELFENYISGVSEDSLGIPKSILASVADQESMLLHREKFAALQLEKQHLAINGLMASAKSNSTLVMPMANLVKDFRKSLGQQYLIELRGLRKEFDDLYAQSQFLYLELMMSEKEQIQGRELHSDSKVSKVSAKKNIKGWSRKNQLWAEGKDEFWWDEVGYHIVNVKPLCKL